MPAPVLDNDQLTDTDQAILRLLRGGRVTAPYVAEELDKSLEYVRSRLRRFREHGHVERVHQGLYELIDDPVEDDQAIGMTEKAIARQHALEAENEQLMSTLETVATALEGQDPDVELARAEIEGALEGVEDGDA